VTSNSANVVANSSERQAHRCVTFQVRDHGWRQSCVPAPQPRGQALVVIASIRFSAGAGHGDTTIGKGLHQGGGAVGVPYRSHSLKGNANISGQLNAAKQLLMQREKDVPQGGGARAGELVMGALGCADRCCMHDTSTK